MEIMHSIYRKFNPLMTRNSLRFNSVLDNIVVADALVLQHQDISNNITNSVLIMLGKYDKNKSLLLMWT